MNARGRLSNGQCRSNAGRGSPDSDDGDAFELRQQRQQLRLDFADHLGAASGNQPRIADELDGVAKSLFGMQQNGLAGDRLVAQPQRRLGLRAVPGKCAGFPAPFIGLPAGIEITERQLRHGPFEMGLRKFRRSHARSFEIPERFERSVKAAQRMAAIGQDLRMTGHRGQRGIVTRKRLDGAVKSQQRIASVDKRADMAGRTRQHGVIARKRLVDTTEFETGVAEIIENFRVIRRKMQRIAVACDRLLTASGRGQRQPEIRQRIRGAGIDLQRRREEVQRLDHAVALEVEHPKQVQRIEIFGSMLQNSGA